MSNNKKNIELIIRYDLLDEFCNINDFVIVTDDMLVENNIYKYLFYENEDNFVGQSVYPKGMPLIMNKIVWLKLINVNNDLKEHGLCLKICDAYRPIEIQKMFWEFFYNKYGYYDEMLVANPNKYGTHNITINAIDMMLVDLDGKDVSLPSEFDDFTEKANIYYDGCSDEAKYNRDLLINIAKKYGLIVNENEWWHYYDERLSEYGMKYNFSQSDLIPKMEEEVFILKIN